MRYKLIVRGHRDNFGYYVNTIESQGYTTIRDLGRDKIKTEISENLADDLQKIETLGKLMVTANITIQIVS